MAISSFIGGPHDGGEHMVSFAAKYVWFDGERAHKTPGKGRALYRLTGVRALYVGGRMALCVCGAYRRRRAHCPFCGSESVAG